jgi:exopolysaccharide biosynthesis polyprenyl glycosylphosphotransferase
MKYYLFNRKKIPQYVLLVGDALVIFLSILISYFIRYNISSGFDMAINIILAKLNIWVGIICLFHLFSLYIFGLYSTDRSVIQAKHLLVILVSVLFSGLMIGAMFFFLPKYIFGRQVLLIHLLVSYCFLLIWRSVYSIWINVKPKELKIALLYSGDSIQAIVDEIESMGQGNLVVSVIYVKAISSIQNCNDSIDNCCSVKNLLCDHDFDILLYDARFRGLTDDETRLIVDCKYKKKLIFDLPTFYSNWAGRIPSHLIDSNWLLMQKGLQGKLSQPYENFKRIVDFVLSLSLLLLFSPFMILIGLVVKCDSVGPVFFVQERLGKNKQPFRCFKYRTMVHNAEMLSGPAWSSRDDPRITRAGKLLRRTRLDELPQLWNILCGDLSFVGPRPIRQHFADRLVRQIPFYDLRFSVAPGLSGWAQVNMDYGGSDEGQRMKFEFELFYIMNVSFFIDALTIIKTIKSVFHGQGS